MKWDINGIQIIGTQRSGSNLLRVILDQSDEIAAPHPPHILSTFVPLMHLYERPGQKNYSLLVDDVISFVEANPVPWLHTSFDREAIKKSSHEQTIFELFKLIYEQATKTKNAKYWCCKSMVNVHYASSLESNGIHPKYIFIYRDGRDIAVSFKKAVVGEKHAYYLAKQWKRDQECCLELMEAMGPERCYPLRYEDLISDPKKNINALCQFLEIGYSEKMLEFYTSETSIAAAESGQMWMNLTKPIIKNNAGKFIGELKREELEVFELVAGDMLHRLGYETVTSMKNIEKLSPDWVEQYDHENIFLKNQMQANNARDMDKRKDQLILIENIKNRSNVHEPYLIL
jgi:hypothetical protein